MKECLKRILHQKLVKTKIYLCINLHFIYKINFPQTILFLFVLVYILYCKFESIEFRLRKMAHVTTINAIQNTLSISRDLDFSKFLYEFWV